MPPTTTCDIEEIESKNRVVDSPFIESGKPASREAGTAIPGNVIPEKTSDEPAFTTLVRELSVLVKRRNEAFRKLRRHQSKSRGNPARGSNSTSENGARTAGGPVCAAEVELNSIDQEITAFLRVPHVYGPTTLDNILADMVEVNGYIVSMRVAGHGLGGELVFSPCAESSPPSSQQPDPSSSPSAQALQPLEGE